MNLIPQPQEIIISKSGEYLLPDTSTLFMPDGDKRLYHAAAVLFREVQVSDTADSFYSLCCGARLPDDSCEIHSGMADAYLLKITDSGMRLKSPTAAGLFYGIQTLRQLMDNTQRRISCLTIRDWSYSTMRCDHFDLRTVHPTVSHMCDYIGVMAQYKINTLLIEYEDKFPFLGMKKLRHPHAMTEEELRLLLTAAYENYIEVIPLQQSFGHLEYVLKHPDYIALREQENTVAELCPLKPGSFAVICSLLKEIASMHPHSRYLHLGGDEVWSIGMCDECRASGLSNTMLFITFLNRLAEYTLCLGKKPIIWHDMLKDVAEEELAQLNKEITVAVWIYSGRHMEARATALIRRFQSAGLHTLGAPSVRCWDETAGQNYPVADKRLANIDAWINTAIHAKPEGLIYTNWSASLALGNPYGLFESTRYLTFLACELSWNPNAARTDYPVRFLSLYHGITDSVFLKEEFTLTDYYLIPDQYYPFCTKNKLTAQLLDLMRQYEVPAKSGLPLQELLFRGEYFPDSEEILTFLREKYKENYAIYDRLRPVMKQLFDELLPPHLSELYLCSRFYLPEIYRKTADAMLFHRKQ